MSLTDHDRPAAAEAAGPPPEYRCPDAPIPEDQELPAPAAVRWLEPDQSYTTVAEFGPFGVVMDQDVNNMARVQRGMKAADKAGATLARYQESMIRWHHHTIDRYARRDDPGSS